MNIFGDEQEALGFARCVRLDQAPESAEMSLAVADEMQRLGVGSALLDRLSGLARSTGIRRFVCEVLADNRGMRALAKRMGGAAHWQGDGTFLYDWSLTEAARTEAAGWPAESGGDLGRSVELWMAIITHALRIGIDQYDAIVHRFLAPSFDEVQYARRWAQ